MERDSEKSEQVTNIKKYAKVRGYYSLVAPLYNPCKYKVAIVATNREH